MKIEIVEDNALNYLQKIASASTDVVIADPPYNLGKDYGNNTDMKTFDEYMDLSRQWIKEVYRILKKSGTIYVFMGVRFISYLFTILEKEYNIILPIQKI